MVETVVQIVTMPNTYTGKVVWVTQQADAPKTLLPPAVATRPFSTAINDDNDDDDRTTSTRPTSTRPTTTATSRRPASTTHTTESEAEETSTAKSTKDQSTLLVATKSPTPSNSGSLVGALVSATASATASISATPTSGASESEGMSGGAKAGLALGILVGVAALLAGILFIYRRKKNAMAGEKDNEKVGMHDAPAPLPPQVPTGAAAAPSIRTNRTMSTAPRLSLRPVTQFDPTFNEQRKSGGNLLSIAAAAAPAAASQDRAAPSEERPVSAWERRGAANAVTDAAPAPTVNPFNDPQTPANSQPPANPFGNSAALDAAHAVIPDSPPQASPKHSAAPSTDLDARVAPAPAAAPEVDAVAVAAAISSVSMPENEFSAPPSVNANADGVPASPAWTEDVPSSPAMGTPMIVGVAGAMTAGHSNGPPGGPNNVHRVQLDFKPSMSDELELKAGTLVRMLHEYDDGWVSLLHRNLFVFSLTQHRHSVSTWIARNKVSCPEPACLSILLSLALDHPVKGLLHRTCVDLLFVRPWVLVASLNLAQCLLPTVAVRLTRLPSHLPAAACPLAPARCLLLTCKALPVTVPTATLLTLARHRDVAARTATHRTPAHLAQCLLVPMAVAPWLPHPKWVARGRIPPVRLTVPVADPRMDLAQ